MIASIELQKAMYKKLETGDYPVYDYIPKTSKMPYIVVGEEIFRDDSTKTEDMTAHLATIHTWSNYKGTQEVKEMSAFVLDSLSDYDLPMDGFSLELFQVETVQTIKELSDNRIIYHGVLQFQFILQED